MNISCETRIFAPPPFQNHICFPKSTNKKRVYLQVSEARANFEEVCCGGGHRGGRAPLQRKVLDFSSIMERSGQFQCPPDFFKALLNLFFHLDFFEFPFPIPLFPFPFPFYLLSCIFSLPICPFPYCPYFFPN